MSINDPLGDMLARICNAQMRHKVKVTTPASKLREHVLDVLAEEGYIRGYARVDYNGGKSEFEIELGLKKPDAVKEAAPFPTADSAQATPQRQAEGGG